MPANPGEENVTDLPLQCHARVDLGGRRDITNKHHDQIYRREHNTEGGEYIIEYITS
jgi:hypothetical protein